MPDWMIMTPENINLAVETLPNPSEGHILPGILLQEAIEANAWHHIHDINIEAIISISKLQFGVPRAYCGIHALIVGSTRLL
jgi:hypothetical protein